MDQIRPIFSESGLYRESNDIGLLSVPFCALEKNDLKNDPFYIVNQGIYKDQCKIGNIEVDKKACK